ncbi:DHA2 family efflux MFS transporter permease subunit [Fontimonas sp. SYSU GA230001]|uniref:DHA2 family efflux MFS transporter permease subunit n=1 Tax=Fontimonas sp. SYSU GA230001 TaxID=3142450 RepID=UPI0032B5AAF1
MTRAPSRALVTIAVMAATVMQTLDTTIANVALPHMQGALSASQDQIAWVLTSYIVAAAIATAPTGWLALRFGRKQVFVTAVLGFTLASILCGLAGSLNEIVAFRILQGLFGAALVPLSQTVLLDSYPPERHGPAMALWGMGVMIGPILGPTLGGWLTEHYDWRWVFYINLPIGLFAAAALTAALPATAPQRAARLDVTGFVFLSLAIGSLQLMLDRGETQDWFGSTEIVVEAVLAVLGLYLFVAHTLTAPRPFLPPRLFRDRGFVAGLLMIGVVGVVMLATSALLPPFLQNLKGYPVVLIGLVMAPRGVGTMLAMLVCGRLLHRLDPRVTIVAGLFCSAASLLWMSGFSLDVTMRDIIGSGVLQGIGLGMMFVSLSTLSFATLEPRDRADATALFSLVRNIGSSIGLALCVAYLSRSTQAAHAALVEHVNVFNPAMAQYVNADGGLASSAGLALIEAEVQRQAAMLALIADFRAIALVVLLALPLLLLFRLPRRTAVPSSALGAMD